jgi:hypothetical protein
MAPPLIKKRSNRHDCEDGESSIPFSGLLSLPGVYIKSTRMSKILQGIVEKGGRWSQAAVASLLHETTWALFIRPQHCVLQVGLGADDINCTYFGCSTQLFLSLGLS